MTTHFELEQELVRLRSEKKRLEESITVRGGKVADAILHPAPVIKATIQELSADKDFRKDLINLVFHFISRYFVNMMDKRPTGNFAEKMADKLFGNTDRRSGLMDILTDLFSKKQS
jgi:hypothetical protein